MYIDVYNADSLKLDYELDTPEQIGALYVGDIFNDNVYEIAYVDELYDGDLYIIDTQTKQQLMTISSYNSGNCVTIGDVNNDYMPEIIWGEGSNIYVAGALEGNLEWHSRDIDGPFNAIAINDIQ